MPWTKTPNVAQYKGANWDNYVKTVPNCSPNQAKLLALQQPEITYFFHCREPIALANGRSFNAHDAVFFSGTQKPRWGNAPQCDGFERFCLSVAYTSADSAEATLALPFEDGLAVDVIVVAANLNEKSTPLPEGTKFLEPSAPGPTMWRANENVVEFLHLGFIKKAHDEGVAVLLCGLNNHDKAGWSQFQSEQDAEQFAGQCAATLEKFELDGIDIDDEYSQGPEIKCSLAMVSYFVDRSIGPRPLSKALFQDTQYAPFKFNNTSIFANLTWGWTMSYWGSPQQQLSPYGSLMPNNQLCCGFWSQQSSPTQADIQWMAQNGYAGIMNFVPTETSEGKQMLTNLLTWWKSGG